MKTFKIWMLGLTLPLLAITPACDDDDDAGDTANGDTANDDGGNNDGGNNDGGNNDGSNNDGGNNDGADSNDDGADSNDDGADSNDDGPSGGGVGDQCTSNDDCSTPICLFAGDADYGFCSIPCEDEFDCPDFWECVEVGNATLTYCAPGE